MKETTENIIIRIVQIVFAIPMLCLAFAPLIAGIVTLVGGVVKMPSISKQLRENKEVAHVFDTVYDDTYMYIVLDSAQACMYKIMSNEVTEIVTPDSIDFSGLNIPVKAVDSRLLWEMLCDERLLNNIVLYKSDIDIPYDFDCKNIQYVTSKVSGDDFCMCPSFCNFRNLKVLKLYGNGIFSYGDGYNDTCKTFVQGCENLETVILSGFESVCIFDGFNYCVNLKTLILENVGRIYIEDGFRVTSKLNYICIVGDTIGKDIEIIGTGKKIMYKNN